MVKGLKLLIRDSVMESGDPPLSLILLAARIPLRLVPILSGTNPNISLGDPSSVCLFVLLRGEPILTCAARVFVHSEI